MSQNIGGHRPTNSALRSALPRIETRRVEEVPIAA